MTNALLPLLFAALSLAAPTPAPAPAPAPYPVNTDTLNCRSSPDLSASIVKTYSNGFDITITCQTTGPKVLTTTVWDKTQDGCFVSDYYVSTGHSAFIPDVPRCENDDDKPTPDPNPEPTPGGGSSGGSGTPCAGINDATVSLIKEFEGYVPSPSPDPIGLPTVGYGHLCQTASCSDGGSFPLSEDDAAALLQKDVARFTACVGKSLDDSVVLNDNQWGALVSWAFNNGCGAVASSTLVERMNAGEDVVTVASEELPQWRMAGGKVMPGLVRRRAAEVELFKTASGKTAHPSCS